MERRTRMWEDRPAHVRYTNKTQEVLEQEKVDSDMARKYFWCEHCGAEKGEPCKADEHDLMSEAERRWHEDWDTHAPRTGRWLHATELERAMLKATDDESA